MKKTLGLMLALIMMIAPTALNTVCAAQEDVAVYINTAEKAALTGTELSGNVKLHNGVSGEWTPSETVSVKTADFNLATDVTKWDYYGFWVYSPHAASAKIKFEIVSNDTSGNTNKSFYTLFNVDWSGWKKIEVKRDTLYAPIKPADYKNIKSFDLYFTNGDGNMKSPLYIDSFMMYNKADDTSDGVDRRTIRDFDTPQAAYYNITSGVERESNTEFTYINNRSVEIKPKDATNFQINLSPYMSVSEDGYINMWVYSKKATGDQFFMALFSNGKWQYAGRDLAVDWEGWKKISCQIVQGSLTKKSNFDANNVDSVRIYFDYRDGWTVSEDTAIYIDKVWYSFMNTAPALSLGTAEIEGKQDADPINSVVSFDLGARLADKNMSAMVSAAKVENCVETPIDGVTALQEGTKLNVYFTKGLEENTEYNVKVNGTAIGMYGQTLDIDNTVSFKTSAMRFEANFKYVDMFGDEITEKPDADTLLYISGTIVNKTASERTVMALVADYDTANKLTLIEKYTYKVSAGETRDVWEAIGTGGYEGSKKIVFVDDLNTLKPITNAIGY